MDFGPFRRHHIQMQKRLLFLVALALIGLAMQAGAQSLNGGSQDCSDPLQHGSSACSGTQQNGSADCSDPLMQGSAQCAQGSNGAHSVGLQNGSQGQNSPLQQLTNQIYQDSNLAAPQPRPTDSVMTVRLPPAPLTEFQKFVVSTTGQLLPVYGASLFRNLPSTFAPLDQTPVPPNYSIGPGDELRIRIWGHVNLTADQKVDRSGDIYLPQIGPIHVGGLSYADLQKHLTTAVGRIYRNFELTVEVGQIRAIQVYVTGQAQRPGLYTVSALSTLANLLFSSGGPSPQGSMRHAELKRDGKTLVDFDLYDLLMRGDKTKDIPVLNGDILFIPAVGAKAAMTGSVVSPAIYELRQGETLADLLKDAGGYSETAATARISVDRIEGHDHRLAMEIPSDEASLATPLHDGDILRVLSIVPGFAKTVTLRGNLGSPGRFAWHEGMRLSDLIPDRNALITRDYWWKRTQLGLPAPEFEPLDVYFNLRQPTSPLDVPLTDAEKAKYNNLHAQDAAQATATPPLGLAAGAALGQSTQSNPASASQLPVQIPGVPTVQGSPASNSASSSNASSQSDPDAEDDSNDPNKPRKPHFLPRKNDVQLDVAEIDWNHASIERTDPQTLKTSLISFDLGRLVQQHDATQDLELQPGDVVTIFSQADIHVPQAQQTKFIRIEGEVANAGIFSVKPGQTLRDLVQQAGGLTPDAYLYGSIFTRRSTQAEQQRRLDQYIQELQAQMQSANAGAAVTASSSEKDAASAAAMQKAGQDMIGKLRQVKATGRIVLEFKSNSASLDSIPAMSLEDGDIFVIPSVPSSVSVVGAVYNQSAFLYQKERHAGNYLHMAGGPNRTADFKRSFIIRADGSVVGRVAAGGPWSSSFKDLSMHPGDSIVIPEKIYNPASMSGLINAVTMFSQLAVGGGTVGYLLTR